MRMPWLVFALVLGAAAPAAAFTSVSWVEAVEDALSPDRAHRADVAHGHRHRQILEAALAPVGFEPAALRFVALQNFLTDWDEYAHTPTHPPNARYRPGDHFDRNEDERSAEAFERGLAALGDRRTRMIRALEAGRTAEALTLFGPATHAVQDAWSHSNLIDLEPSLQREAQALLDGRRPTPSPRLLAKLRLTGVCRRSNADLPPADDREPGFGHDRFAKDDVRYNAEARRRVVPGGPTQYERAFAAATIATEALARRFEAGVSPAAWRKALTYAP
jgi:hypothetical protein